MFHRRSQTAVLPYTNSFSRKAATLSINNLLNLHKTRCVTRTDVALSALIPLMIGIFTVVSYTQQQKIDDRRREQDQKIANWTRQQDQQQVDELYYQSVYKTYIEDISNILFKLPLTSDQIFIDNQTRLSYIRSKTLTALEELDWQRKTRLFVFLYEQKLLPQSFANETLDLSGANLFNITLKRSFIKNFQFNKLSLPSVDLTNASFVECHFREGVSFSNSAMTNIKLMRSRFICSKNYANVNDSIGKVHVWFDRSTMEQADFRESFLCDVNFNTANLIYANFHRAVFQGQIDMVGTNLAYADFSETLFHYPVLVNIVNANLTGTELVSDQLNRIKERGDLKMNNVILPNGSWSMNATNLVLNGNAEANCFADSIPNWVRNNEQYFSYPKLFNNQSSSYQCSFNFSIDTAGEQVSMYQDIDIRHFSFFIDSSTAEYQLLVDVGNCEQGILTLHSAFYTSIWTRLAVTSYNFTRTKITEKLEWNRWINLVKIVTDTRHLRIQFVRQEQGPCFLDNIELRIQRGREL